MGNVIASALDGTHIADFDTLIEQRLANLDKEAVLVYLVDVVKSPALIFLADQFDVLGFKGWALTQTEADRRALIKKAIELHKTKGTPHAIKEALKQVGFPNAQIQERLNLGGVFHDGVFRHNGTRRHGPTHWATFRVSIDASIYGAVTADVQQLIVALIMEYKNVRSRLLDVNLVVNVTETPTAAESFVLSEMNYPVENALTPYHNGLYVRDGSRQYQQDYFTLNITHH